MLGPCHPRFAEALSADLSGIEAALRGGAADWREDSRAQLPEPIASPLDAAWRAGVPLGESLKAGRRLLQHAAADLRADRAVATLFPARLAVALVVAVSARTLVVAFGLSPPPDHVAIALAALLVVAGLGVWCALLPTSWIFRGDGTVRPAFGAWFAAHLAGAPAGVPVDARLAELAERELGLGVSLLSERRQVLLDYAEARAAAAMRCRTRAVDLLPLLELAGIGLPVALVLLAPMLALVGATSPAT
jgi:hypothetical protein